MRACSTPTRPTTAAGMDAASYRPESPDLSLYAPESPDLSGVPQPHHQSPYAHPHPQFGGAFASPPRHAHHASPTSVPAQPYYPQHQHHFAPRPNQRVKTEHDDDDYLPDAPAHQHKRQAQSLSHPGGNSSSFSASHSPFFPASHSIPSLQQQQQPPSDPTFGVQLKTSFPVARIKRIMQADEDIGKVAQVTPHVVSRALELFMIKLITASAAQARGGTAAGAASSKGPRRILAQHMKRAIATDDTFDFLADILSKVPDAPPKAKKEAVASDSENEDAKVKAPKKRVKKRKDSGDDF
ncbi:hypothetical protein ES702_02645 [subsurface metagenome]